MGMIIMQVKLAWRVVISVVIVGAWDKDGERVLSGGEKSRLALCRMLFRPANLLLLDEPTTGLHFHDIQMLLNVLQRLRDHGNTIVVIEHNLDVIKTADWIIDLGPEGGDGGGEIIFEGPPEEIIKSKKSYTGKFLKKYI